MKNQACVLSVVINNKISKKFFFRSNSDLKREALEVTSSTGGEVAEIIREAVDRYLRKLKEESIAEFRFIQKGVEVVISSCSCTVFK